MKLAHISDTHLGYYAYGRTAHGRFNQREVDVCETFRRCLDAIADRDPDLVIHSGDLFHVVRPSNYSLIAAYKLVSNFQMRRMGKPFVIIGGNHDTPQSAETTNILRLFEDIEGVYVEADTAKQIEAGDATILCLPHRSLASGENVSWAPPANARHRILTLHGIAAETKIEPFHFELNEARAEEWTYVAMGDFHIHRKYGRNICYAGSTDFTSNDPWSETSIPKGWVWFDTEVGELEFVPQKTRAVLDLPLIDAEELTAEQVGDQMMANAQWDSESMPIVRQVVVNLHWGTRREMPLTYERSIAAKCLYYRFDRRSPADIPAKEVAQGQAAALETCWETHIDATPLPSDVDKAAVKKLGLEFLQEVAENEAAPVEA